MKVPFRNSIIGNFMVCQDRLETYLLHLFAHTGRAGFKPMQPMQLHWAPHHGVWVDCSFLPDTPCA